ncbi:unnamed protein product [Moneuplotes crassus]|uniref:Uncharacterized protein n=1 Tax=Euplotes crassus TaxID=5936 RepID=A0AAD2D873_EUPCR|nr:unnamed protein product [Moneuplotes crassus]
MKRHYGTKRNPAVYFQHRRGQYNNHSEVNETINQFTDLTTIPYHPQSKFSRQHKPKNSSHKKYQLKTTLNSPSNRTQIKPSGNLSLSDNTFSNLEDNQGQLSSLTGNLQTCIGNNKVILPSLPPKLINPKHQRKDSRKTENTTKLEESKRKAGNRRFVSPTPQITEGFNQTLINPNYSSILQEKRGKASVKFKERHQIKQKALGDTSNTERPEFIIKKKFNINRVNFMETGKAVNGEEKTMKFPSNPTNETLSSIVSNLNKKLYISPKVEQKEQKFQLGSPLLIKEFENSPMIQGNIDQRLCTKKSRGKSSPHNDPELKQKMIVKGKEKILEANMQQNDAVINLTQKIIKRTQINEQIRKQLTVKKRQDFEPTKCKDEPQFHNKRIKKSKEKGSEFEKNFKHQEDDKKKLESAQMINIEQRQLESNQQASIQPVNRNIGGLKTIDRIKFNDSCTVVSKGSKIPISPNSSFRTNMKSLKKSEINFKNQSKDMNKKDTVNIYKGHNNTSYNHTNDTSFNEEKILKGIRSGRLDSKVFDSKSNEQSLVINKKPSSNTANGHTAEGSKNSNINLCISPYSSINKESNLNKVSCKVPLLKKTIDSLMMPTNVVNEADESQNEDSILRKSSNVILEGEGSSTHQENRPEKLSSSSSRNDKVKHKDRYYEESKEYNNHPNRSLTSSLCNESRQNAFKVNITKQVMLDFSKEGSLNLESKSFGNKLKGEEDEVLLSDDEEIQILNHPIKGKAMKRSFDEIPLEVIPKNLTKINLTKKKTRFDEEDDSIVLNSEQAESEQSYKKEELRDVDSDVFNRSIIGDGTPEGRLKLLDQECCEEDSQRLPTPEAKLDFTPRKVFFLNQERDME